MADPKSQIETAHIENDHAAASLARALAGPLNSLLAMGELLQRQPLTPSANRQLQAMLDIGRRMASLLSDTLDAKAVDAPAPSVPTSLRELVDDVESLWRFRMGEKAERLLISCNAAEGLRLMLDPTSVRRLLNVLIGTAVDASAQGVIELHLTAHAQSDGFISVEGRFDAPDDDACSSNGLTLDLCRTLIQQMGGTFSRANQLGSGVQTLFAFRAPEASRDAADAPEAEDSGAALPRTHLLIVDDNATNRIVAAALCEMFGCTSETAEDGLEALDAVKTRPFDLILMDIKMPRMDGLEATKAIRALSTAAAATPIVALTANADPDSVAAYLACGMQAVVDKPIKPAQLLSTLQSVLCEADNEPRLQAAVA